jgi:hypothetical protein
MQLIEGKHLLSVELGLSQVRAPVLAPVWPIQVLAGALPRHSPSGTSACEEIELGGLR